MKMTQTWRVALATLAASSLLSIPSDVQANPGRPKSVVVDGETTWPEVLEVIKGLQELGLPIESPVMSAAYGHCRPDSGCILIKHYRDNQDAVAYTTVDSRGPGYSEIGLNDAHDRGHFYRIHVLYHEFGHALGILKHNPNCASVMHDSIGQCPNYILGYDNFETADLKRIWAS